MSLELDPAEEVAYRLALAREHLDRARRRFQVEAWAGVVEAAQLAAENAAKAVIAHFHVPSWSHDPSRAHPHPRPPSGGAPLREPPRPPRGGFICHGLARALGPFGGRAAMADPRPLGNGALAQQEARVPFQPRLHRVYQA